MFDPPDLTLTLQQHEDLTRKQLEKFACIAKAVCSPPSRSRRVTRIMSIDALVFNGFG